jgi:hypothetical protein
LQPNLTDTPRGVSTRPEFLEMSGLPLGRLADHANTSHLHVEECCRGALLHARRAGECLMEAQRQVSLAGGAWLPWVQEHCCFSPRTSQRYMRVAREWERIEAKTTSEGGDATPVSHLGYREALELLTDRRAEGPPPAPTGSGSGGTNGNGKGSKAQSTADLTTPGDAPGDQASAEGSDRQGDVADAAPEPALDALGRPVPPDLIPAFAARETFREARLLVRRLNVLITAMATSPGGAHLARDLSRREDQGRVYYRSRNLEDFDAALKFYEPHSALCPWCEFEHRGRTDRACKACFGLGWVPFQLWKQAPAEYRAAAGVVVDHLSHDDEE